CSVAQTSPASYGSFGVLRGGCRGASQVSFPFPERKRMHRKLQGQQQAQLYVSFLTPYRCKTLDGVYGRRSWTSAVVGAGEVGFAAADLVGAVNFALDVAVGVGGAAWLRVVAEEILGAKFAVDAVEDGVEFLNLIGVEHRAAHRIGDGVERVFAGGV